ncbi:hypothetical protein B0H10DRAFT_1757422, partial [Mycena sp. CBHHK59/15]
IHDPSIILGKGRPWTEHFTGGTEGRPRGGGAGIRSMQRPQYQVSKWQNSCSICWQAGHNRMSCPQ